MKWEKELGKRNLGGGLYFTGAQCAEPLFFIGKRFLIYQDAGRRVALPGKREGKGHCLIGFIVDEYG
jgi:hypothetical protein